MWVIGLGGRGVTSRRRAEAHLHGLRIAAFQKHAGSHGCTSGETCSGNGHCHYSSGVEMCFPLGKSAGEAVNYYFPSDAKTLQSSG